MVNVSLKKILQNIINWVKNPNIKWSTDSTGNRFFRVTNTSNEGVGYGYGSGQANHGIWSEKMNKWMIYSNGTQTYIDQKDPFNSSNQSAGTLPGARLPVLLKIQAFTSGKFSQNAGAGSGNTVTITAPSGYGFIGIVGFSCAHNQAGSVGAAYRTGKTSAIMATTNRSSNAWSDMTITVYALFALSDIW